MNEYREGIKAFLQKDYALSYVKLKEA